VDAYTTALTLLSRRELSTKQLRERLARKHFDERDIDRVVERLVNDRALDDRRVAFACARTQASTKGYGRRRVLQRVQQLGVSADIARLAVDDVFGEMDEVALLDAAIEKRLRGSPVTGLDAKGKARLVRHLVARGFEPSQVYARLRTGGADLDE
jgi:regulatory protein